MKAKLFLLMIALLVLYSCGKPQEVQLNDLTIQGFKGKVQKVEIEYFDNRNKKDPDVVNLKTQNRAVIEYNANGKKTSHLVYNADDSLFLESSYTYNDRGQLTEVQTSIPELFSDMKAEVEYNDKDEVTALTIYDADEVFKKIEIIYNAEGNVSEIISHSADKHAIGRRTFKYDQNPQQKQYFLAYNVNADDILEKEYIPLNPRGKIGVKEPIFDYKSFESSDILLSSILAPLNKTGNLIEKAAYKKDGSLKATISYVYDDQGRLVEKEHLDHNGTMVTKNLIEYKKDNIQTHVTYYTPENIRHKEHLVFNNKDNLELYIRTNPENIFQSKHKYVTNNGKKTLTKKILSYEDQLYEKSVFTYDGKINVVDYSYYVMHEEKEVINYRQTIKYTYYK